MTFAVVDVEDLKATPGSPLYEHPKIRTHTGLLVDPWNLSPEDVRMDDIAYALAHENRYGGHVGTYSVAQHSLIVASYFHQPLLRLAGLLHDAEEAYLKDMMSPIKARPEMAAYKAAGKRVRAVIWGVYGLGEKHDILEPKVKMVDEEVYFRERASFSGELRGPLEIVRMEPAEAYFQFRYSAIDLLKEVGVKYV